MSLATASRKADYTTRKNYQQNYSRENREAIRERKRKWRQQRKLVPVLDDSANSIGVATASK